MKDAMVWQKLWRAVPLTCCLLGLWGVAFGQGNTVPGQVKSPRPSPVSSAAERLSCPPGRPLLEPGHVKVTVFAGSRKGLKGRYIFSPLVRYVSNMAFAPDGSLYFNVGLGGSGLPLAKITPQGKVVVVARPEVMDPRHMFYFDFGPIAITPKGRVYVLYRGLAEIKADGKIDLLPLRNEAGKLFTEDDYPNLWYLAAGPDGRLYVTDQRTVWRIGSDYVLRPIKNPAELPPPVRVGLHLWKGFHLWKRLEVGKGLEDYYIAGAVLGRDHYLYAIGLRLIHKEIPSYTYNNLLRFKEIGNSGNYSSSNVKILVRGAQLPHLLAIGIDRLGNLYVGTRDTIYKISPTESSK